MKYAGILSLVLWIQSICSAAGPEVGDEGTVQRLVERLGSNRFTERESAARKLMELEEAPAALIAATKSDDPEVVRQAKRIIADIERHAAWRVLARGMAAADRGEFDRFLEAVLGWPAAPDDGLLWQAVYANADRLAGSVGKKSQALQNDPWRGVPGAVNHFRDFRQILRPTFHSIKDTLEAKKELTTIVARSAGVSAEFIRSSILASSGPVEVKTSLGGCIVFCDGNLRVGSEISHCVIFCDGEVAAERITRSVIFAHGNVAVQRGTVDQSAIVTSGEVVSKWRKRFLESTIREGEWIQANFVNYFQPGRLGLDASPVEGGMRLGSLYGKNPFYIAGLRSGDVIVAVDGAPTQTAETFRKQLLRASVRDRTVLTVRRSNETLQLNVPFPILKAEQEWIDRWNDKDYDPSLGEVIQSPPRVEGQPVPVGQKRP
jgi:PDZ domain